MADLDATRPSEAIVALYERRASEFDRDRGRTLHERAWLDRLTSGLPPRATLLDIGCGTGEPIAGYLIQCGCRVTGLDSSPSMITFCRGRFPDAEGQVGDMRELSLGRRFDGLVAWDSFFHLTGADQRAMFPRFAAHASPGGRLLFTSGPREGEAVGSWYGEPLYHASLDPEEYETLLRENGFRVREFGRDDPDCGNHTVWLAEFSG